MDFLGASVVSCQLSVVSCQLWGALGIARMLDRKPLRLTQANSENSSKKSKKCLRVLCTSATNSP